MQETQQSSLFPPIKQHMEELESQLKESYKLSKTECVRKYTDLKQKRLKELRELNQYKTLQRKGFISQSKNNGQLIDKTKDIFLCKEPLIDDFVKCHILEPQRNLEKGLIGIKTGTKEYADSSCFGQVPISKLSYKEKKFFNYWKQENNKLNEIIYQDLLDSQTGIQKKKNQQRRLQELKVFIPNSYCPGYFDNHPSQILALTQLHQHSQTMKWKPNSFYGEVFEQSFCQESIQQQTTRNQSILNEIDEQQQQQ